ncbi:SDR family oxidoreductase [Haladaptatus sp. DYSN1]|uniref:SDR family oxidoreductase n=1 Tax=unclassified Haladaptatus TaxID=2622732 RepID=UPI0024062172|nr:SDR family oxidoreductase [Haladaptatus sp. DYSN1]
MSVEFDFSGTVVVVTGASGALGSTVANEFAKAGATVCAADVVEPDEGTLVSGITFYEGDFTDETDVKSTFDEIADTHGQVDALINIAGTWKGGTHIEETDVDTFDMLFSVNLKTMFLASKHAIPHLKETEGAIVSTSARASLEGGEGDGPYRAAKTGVRLLTETIAEENKGTVRANAIMPSVIDTPQNREAMPDADHDKWVEPAEIARVIMFLCSDAADVTSGAAVPVYGEA